MDFLPGGINFLPNLFGGGETFDLGNIFGNAQSLAGSGADVLRPGGIDAGAPFLGGMMADPTQSIASTQPSQFSLGGALGGAADFAKGLAPFAGLGVTGMGMANAVKGMQQGAEQNKILQQAQRFQQQAAQPALNAGSALTSAGQQAILGGPLPPQMEAEVQAFGEQARAQFRQYFAHAGISDSTMMGQMEGWINEQMQLMRDAKSQALLQSGYAGIATAVNPATQMAATAQREMGGENAALASANAAISAITGAQRPEKQQSG